MMTDLVIDLPVRTVYDQWTQFEDFPLFMEHVEKVEQLDDTHLRWTARISGISRTWDSEITEQTPDQRIAWTATDGTENRGVVTFHPLNDDQTKVVLQMEVDPQGLLEQIADKGGYIRDRTRKDLQAFKDFIEQRGRATGEWRGTVQRDPDRSQKEARTELLDLTREELYERAKERDITGRSQMTRDELVDALVAEDVEHAR